MTRDEFNILVAEALDTLPDEFKEKLDNVEVVVEDIPSRSQLSSVGLTYPMMLYGLYHGVPKTKRGHYTFVAPDKISVFKIPIETRYRTPEAIRQKVRSVVLHEIGHHFGMSETELQKHAE
jgi:predicted Zn-dependent protease with MMP-like domain